MRDLLLLFLEIWVAGEIDHEEQKEIKSIFSDSLIYFFLRVNWKVLDLFTEKVWCIDLKFHTSCFSWFSMIFQLVINFTSPKVHSSLPLFISSLCDWWHLLWISPSRKICLMRSLIITQYIYQEFLVSKGRVGLRSYSRRNRHTLISFFYWSLVWGSWGLVSRPFLSEVSS